MTVDFPYRTRKLCFDALKNVILPLALGCGL